MASEKTSLPLQVMPCSRQDGKERYPVKEDVKAPSIAMFRNNLTALSQYRNLLFVAYVDQVYVYTPSFPEQTIANKPELAIDLPRSRPGLRGYLDTSRPHAVNHLIVGDIGDEEVVVIACDDGDVISYTVQSISLAIDEGTRFVFAPQPYQDQKLKCYRQSGWANLILPVASLNTSPGLRVLAPWFHENVGASAWGLATHKGAMLLAVSSNTKEINVFAPSLSPKWNPASRSKDPPPKTMERYRAWETKNPIALRDRSVGRKVTLRGHAANIPNVAFCNNSLDPKGSYLASTDIDGYTILWDIWRGDRVLKTLGNTSSHIRGWAVACLDPRNSRPSGGPVNTFGCACRVDESNTLIDNSEAGELILNNSQWHPGFSALGSVPGMLPTGTIPTTLQTVVQLAAATTADQDLEVESEPEDEVYEDSDDLDDPNDTFDEDAVDDGQSTDLQVFGEAMTDHHDHTFDAASSDPMPYTLDPLEVEHLHSDENSMLEDTDSDLPDLEEVPVEEHTDHQPIEAPEEDSKTLSPGHEEDMDRSLDATHANTSSTFTDLPFSLLQTDERNIHLFRDIRFSADPTHPPNSSHSHVLCQQALNQRMPPGFNYLIHTERLNMIAQIPELGVVVIGNQVGRVGLLTMTRWEAQKQSGYRIECILPFLSEEEKGMRPRKPLLGMAVAPIQGQERALPRESPRMGVKCPRRFRLLMMYCDHTVLSYELSRPDEEGDLIVV